MTDKKYRPVPFWSWNDKLDIEETKEQVRLMDEAGIGGFFMHARGGLKTPYMEEEWFKNVEAAVSEAEKRGMHPWAYDENGWPSGFASGKVNGLGEKYQQKFLRMSEEKPSKNIIGKSGDHWFYYDVNPYYVDIMDPEVIREFIKAAYEPYYERFGNRIEGFFTDEPQLIRCDGIAWSFVTEKAYKERYGEELLPHLEELFLEKGDYANTRIRYWKLVTDLLSESYFKQIYDWCDKRGYKFTGHLMAEDSLLSQLPVSGCCMPHYRYFHIPGLDWLDRRTKNFLSPYQVSSAAAQCGKEAVITEAFALCGHNVSFWELDGIYGWLMAHGINLLCQHLQGYSIKGIRKRDFPPQLFYQQPWWDSYSDFNDKVAAMGELFRNGTEKPEVLLIHPSTSAWTMYDVKENKGLAELDAAFHNQIAELERKHVLFHLGDETLLEDMGSVEGNRLRVGKMTYSAVIPSCGEYLLPNTKKLLAEFEAKGGKILKAEEVKDNPVCSNPDIQYTMRDTAVGRLHFFVNPVREKKETSININGYEYNPVTGEKTPLQKTVEIGPWGNILILEDETAKPAEEVKFARISDSGEYRIIEMSDNILTLDRCDYWFDGVLQEKNGYVLNIAERANALGHGVDLKQEYHVKVSFVPERIFLVCEEPQFFDIKINGRPVEVKASGWLRDKNFKKLDINGYLTRGDNVITFETRFEQSEEFYEKISRVHIFEGIKNSLAYDREIEAVYLAGDFGVETPGTWEELERRAGRYKGEFIIGKRPETVRPDHLERQGFPFFAGTMTLEKEIDLPKGPAVLSFDRTGIQTAAITLGSLKAKLVCKHDVRFEGDGERKTLTIRTENTLRNMLGPHHMKVGECFNVNPGDFFKEACMWNRKPEPAWDEDYCFVETTLNLI